MVLNHLNLTTTNECVLNLYCVTFHNALSSVYLNLTFTTKLQVYRMFLLSYFLNYYGLLMSKSYRPKVTNRAHDQFHTKIN